MQKNPSGPCVIKDPTEAEVGAPAETSSVALPDTSAGAPVVASALTSERESP